MNEASFKNKRTICSLLASLVVALLLRIIFASHSVPVCLGDSKGYFALAYNMVNANLENYDGLRTPGYPVLLWALGCDLERVRAVQLVIGVGSCALLFWLLWRRTGSNLTAFVATTIFASSMGQITFESAMMTETLSTFLLLLSLCVLVKAMLRPTLPLFLALAAIAGLTTLTRPSYAFLVFLFCAFLIAQPTLKTSKRQIAASFLIACLLPLLWCCFNLRVLGSFTLTTLTGHGSLMSHALKFLDAADDDKLHLKEILLRNRDYYAAKDGSEIVPFTVWLADKEMNEKTHTTVAQRVPIIQALALDAIRHRPFEYLASVCDAWRRFWEPSNYMFETTFERTAPNRFLGLFDERLWRFQGACWLYLRWLMLPVVAWQLAWLTKGRCVWSDFDLLVAAIIISVAVSQALLALGDNSRYAIGVEPLIFYLYCATAWRLEPACGKLLKHENTPQRR